MRDYDPTTGRYLQADPLGLVDGASVYGYALGNPGRWVDPRGEQALNLLGGPLSVPSGGYASPNVIVPSMPSVNDYVDFGDKVLDWSRNYNPIDLALQEIIAVCMPDQERACDDGYEADIAICRQLTRSSMKRSWYSQAMERLAACRAGLAAPPFPYP